MLLFFLQEIKQISLDDSNESPSQVLAGELRKLSIHDESIVSKEELKVSPELVAEQTEQKAALESIVGKAVTEDTPIPAEVIHESSEKCPPVDSESAEKSLIPSEGPEKVATESSEGPEEPAEPSTPRSTVAEPASTPPSTPLTSELAAAPIPAPDQLVEVCLQTTLWKRVQL